MLQFRYISVKFSGCQMLAYEGIASNKNFSHLPTRSSQPPNLHISITSSLFNLLATLAVHLSSLSLDTNIILVTCT